MDFHVKFKQIKRESINIDDIIPVCGILSSLASNFYSTNNMRLVRSHFTTSETFSQYFNPQIIKHWDYQRFKHLEHQPI